MRPYRSWPLAAKLSIDLVLCALVPLAIAILIASGQSRRELGEAARRDLRLVAQVTAARLDQLIDDTSKSNRFLALHDAVLRSCLPGARPEDRDGATRRLRALIDTNADYASAFVLDANGIGVASTNRRNIGQDLSFRAYTQDAIAGREHVTDFVVGSTTGEAGVYFAAPVLAPDEPGDSLGGAVIKLRGARIWEIIDEVRTTGAGHAVLIDSAGVIIAHPDKARLYHSLGPLTQRQIDAIDPRTTYGLPTIKSLGMPELMRALEASPLSGDVAFTVRTPDGDQDRVAGWASMSRRDWKVAVVRPQADVNAAAMALVREQVGVGVAIAALAGSLALWRARSVVRPLRRVSDAAEQLAMGDFTARAPKESDDEIGRLADAFNRMVPRLENAVQLQHSLEVASEVQKSLLPQGDPTPKRLEVAGRTRYCEGAGGDYYDFIDVGPSGEGATMIAVGDVMGHGIASALLMASARASLRTGALESGKLSELMMGVNKVLAEGRHRRFMTMSLIVIDPAQGSARWASAGHDPPILYRPSEDAFEELEGGDMPLGLDGDVRYEEYARSGLQPGDFIVIGTDGIWEAASRERELFGKDRLRALIREHSDAPATQLADAIERAVASHRGPEAQQDDLTFVIVVVR